MPFERFTKGRARGGVAKVSIWTKGQIAFNRGAVLDCNLNEFKYAVLFFNAKDKKIAIEFTNNPKEPDLLKLTRKGDNLLCLSCRIFLIYYKIDFEKTRVYNFEFDSDKNRIEFSI